MSFRLSGEHPGTISTRHPLNPSRAAREFPLTKSMGADVRMAYTRSIAAVPPPSPGGLVVINLPRFTCTSMLALDDRALVSTAKSAST